MFELTYQARFATFVVVDVRAELPTLPSGRAFIVVPRAHLAAGLIDRPLTTTSLFLRGAADPTTEGALRDALADAGAGVRLQSRAGQLAAFRDRPLVEAVERGFALALAAAIGYAALAILVSLTLAGSARARETAHLRTLGLDRRQVVALAILEHGPPVLVAVVAGLVLGVGVGWIVLPGLGLAAFTGGAARSSADGERRAARGDRRGARGDRADRRDARRRHAAPGRSGAGRSRGDRMMARMSR